MDIETWTRIKDLFAEAIELPESDRENFLAGIRDIAVREELGLMLRAHFRSPDFIERPAVVEHGFVESGPEDCVDDVRIGSTIDEYKIIEKIGSGGMGSVYLAEHSGDGFNKRVALKLIKRGMDTDLVMKRFLMERQILGRLEHPNIATMLDGGSTAEGSPYFVMEYVNGVSIKAFCESNRLSTRKRLELFMKVCSAVSYAQQNLVVHRDLKPSNILINKDGEPKLPDFGISKLLSPDWAATTTEATATQFKVLTPEYASPEQFRGEMTTTGTDVYSLGIVLYELLTGRRPFQFAGMSSSEIAEVLLSQEPVKPSTAALNPYRASTVPNSSGPANDVDDVGMASVTADSRSLKGDLDNIVLKAIRREPERRYTSVQEMADDIQRHLDGMPVTATADTFMYRTGKFISRNRPAFFTAVLVSVLLVASASTAIWQAVRANEQRAAAEERFNDVRALANSLIFDLHDSIMDLPGATPARKLLVARALEYLDKLAKEGSNDMSLQMELAAGYEKIADVQGNPLGPNLGEIDGAIESYTKALNLRETLFEKGTPEDRYATAMLHSKLFRIMQTRGLMDDAESHCRRAAMILERLSADDETAPLYRVTAARFFLELGDLLVTRTDGDVEQALENYRKSISLSESIPASPVLDEIGGDGLSLREKMLSVTQMAYRRLGQRFELRQQNDEALSAYRRAMEESEKLVAAGNPRKPSAEIVLAISLGNLGRLEAATGDPALGMEKVDLAIEISERTFAADKKNYLAASELALANWNAGKIFLIQNEPGRSLASFQKALDIQKRLLENNPNDLYNLGNLAETYASIGYANESADGAEARKWYQLSYEIWKQMKDRNVLAGYYAHKPGELEQSLARVTSR